MPGLSLQQIQQMGGKPVVPQQPTPQGGLTLAQIQQMGGQPTQAPQGPNFGERVGGVIQQAGKTASEQIAGTGEFSGQSSVRRGVGATETAFNAIPSVAMQTLPETKNFTFRSGLQKLGEAIGNSFQGGVENIVNVGDFIAKSPILQKFAADNGTTIDKISKPLEDILGTLKSGGNIATDILTADQAAKGGQAVVDNIIGDPTITVAGRTFTTDQIHTPEATQFIENLPEPDKAAMAQFDSLNSIKQQIENAAKAGDKEAVNLLKGELDSKFTPPEGSTATLSDNGLLTKFKNMFGASPEADVKAQADITEARQSIADQYKKSLPLTPLQQSKEMNLLNKTGANVYTTLAKYNASGDIPNMIDGLQNVSDQFKNVLDETKANENNWFNLDDVTKDASSQIDEKIPSSVSRTTAKAKITKEIAALQQELPDEFHVNSDGTVQVSSDVMERLRQTGNSWTPYNASDPQKVGMSTGYSLSDAVRNEVEKNGTFPAYREANRQWGSVIHAQEVLTKLESSGKNFKLLGGMTGTIARRILSGAIGFESGGLGGAIISELTSEYGTKILSNPDLWTYFDRKLIEEGGSEVTPQILKDLKTQVDAYVANNAEHPVLQGQTSPIDSGNKPMEMGVYKLGKNPVTGMVEPTGQYKNPEAGQNFYPKATTQAKATPKPIAAQSKNVIPKSVPPTKK